MAEAKDILLDEKYKLIVKNGDFVFSFSDQQHVNLLILTDVGHWREFPLVGVGIRHFINSAGMQARIKRSVQVQVENDGYKIQDLEVKDWDKIYINAERI